MSDRKRRIAAQSQIDNFKQAARALETDGKEGLGTLLKHNRAEGPE